MNSIYYVPTDSFNSGKISPLTTDEDESTAEDRQGKLSRGQSRIEFERLAQFFHVPINEAAKGLGVCATVLKKVCRKYGIPRWPHRKIKKLDTLLAMLESSAAKNTTNNPHHDDDVRRKIESVTRDRMILLTEGKLDDACTGPGKTRVSGQKRSNSVLTAPTTPLSANVTSSRIRGADHYHLQQEDESAKFDKKNKGRDRKKRRLDLNSSSSLEDEDLSSLSDHQASSPEDGSVSSSGYASPISISSNAATPPFEYSTGVEFGGSIEFASVEFNTPSEFATFDYPSSSDYATSSQVFTNPYSPSLQVVGGPMGMGMHMNMGLGMMDFGGGLSVPIHTGGSMCVPSSLSADANNLMMDNYMMGTNHAMMMMSSSAHMTTPHASSASSSSSGLTINGLPAHYSGYHSVASPSIASAAHAHAHVMEAYPAAVLPPFVFTPISSSAWGDDTLSSTSTSALSSPDHGSSPSSPLSYHGSTPTMQHVHMNMHDQASRFFSAVDMSLLQAM